MLNCDSVNPFRKSRSKIPNDMPQNITQISYMKMLLPGT